MKVKYSLLILFVIERIIYSQNPCPGTPTVTYAGKTYNTVQIGAQCWLKENLDVGKRINHILVGSDDGIVEKYCYDDDENNCTTYGGLYSWAEAVQYKNGATNSTLPNPAFSGNIQGICPDGWHLPTKAEFESLNEKTNNSIDALLSVGQFSGNNNTGFSALLASCWRGGYQFLGFLAYFWTSTQSSNYGAYKLFLNYYVSTIYLDYEEKIFGFSVRCIKDNNSSVSVDQENKDFPSQYSLLQNYPNPFNPMTTMKYSIPKSQFVSLKVYDMIGREITTLVDENKNAGNYEAKFESKSLASGIYYYQLKSGDYLETKKMILMK